MTNPPTPHENEEDFLFRCFKQCHDRWPRPEENPLHYQEVQACNLLCVRQWKSANPWWRRFARWLYEL